MQPVVFVCTPKLAGALVVAVVLVVVTVMGRLEQLLRSSRQILAASMKMRFNESSSFQVRQKGRALLYNVRWGYTFLEIPLLCWCVVSCVLLLQHMFDCIQQMLQFQRFAEARDIALDQFLAW